MRRVIVLIYKNCECYMSISEAYHKQELSQSALQSWEIDGWWKMH